MKNAKSAPKKIENVLVVYARLFQYVKKYWVSLMTAIVASAVYSGVDAWFVYFLKPLLNEGLVAKNHQFLAWAPFLVLFAFGARGIASFFSNYNIAYASRNVIRLLRQHLFAHLQKLPARYYDHNTGGQILSVILYSVEQIANASTDVLTTAIRAGFLIVGLLFVMFTINWKLSLMYFLIIPLITIVMRIASKRVRRLSLSIQDSMASLTHHAEENIIGYKVVRAFDGQADEIHKFNQASLINNKREMKVVAARAWSVSSVQLIAAFALSVTLYVATLDIAKSIFSPGSFVAMIAAMLALLKPMKDLTTMQNKLYRGVAGAQTAFELLDEPPENDLGTKTLERAMGKITFAKVNFAYKDEMTILHNLDFTIHPGEVVALVGRSGTGKSTLVNLMLRFYANFTGDILLDDVSVHDYRLMDLRRQFSMVSQNVILFNDTIKNNIAYGRSANMTDDEVMAAAKAAYAHEFIQSLPEGIHSLIGENGVLLSGGQRQRIAIARAILKNAPILILDEATSALDTESERYIQAALEHLMRKCTTFVIAHRLSTVEHADKIIVLDQGRIVEMGNHADLLMRDGCYAKLYKMQFKEVETAYA